LAAMTGEARKTPMMQQWEELKASAPQSLLFFRLGDFFELFGEDAVKAAPVMQVVLTSRGSKSEDNTPLCGVPAHNFEIYLHRLLDHGFSVALAEQTEEAKPGKNLVRREIVQHFTPGMRLLEQTLDAHYTAVVASKSGRWILAAADVATGDLHISSGTDEEELAALALQLPVQDLRVAQGQSFDIPISYQATCQLIREAEAQELILSRLQLADWRDSPVSLSFDTQVLATLLKILDEAHPNHQLIYQRPSSHEQSVWLSASTQRHLNLFEPKENSLFSFLDRCHTSMGRRQLKLFLTQPTQDLERIKERQSFIHELKSQSFIRKQLQKKLSGILDIHRLFRRKQQPGILTSFRDSLDGGLRIFESLKPKHSYFQKLKSQCDGLLDFMQELDRCIQVSKDSEVGWIKKGVNSELDELRNLERDADKKLSQLEERLREEFSIPVLKIRFHQVFGFIAEVTATHKSKVPTHIKIIQTLANAIRFKTPEIEELEQKLLSLKSRIKEAEQAQIDILFEKLNIHRNLISEWADQIGIVDALTSLAEVSTNYGWSQPRTSRAKDQRIILSEATHPLVKDNFVPLSFKLMNENNFIMLLSGPNMAGKSTLLRVAALCALLHQMGSDVPAKDAELSIFDSILCRMGAMDDLGQGKSTFFVEMREVATMLQSATSNSLLLFDELGRGTSTYDGMSLAWAIIEEVHQIRSLSIVATHYLELATLERKLSGLKNFHVGVKELEGRLIFTRRLEEGPASQSYGIQVARLANIADPILQRAEAKLREFEKRRSAPTPLFELQARKNENSVH